MQICLTNHQSPGDVLMLTAAIRDLKQKYPHIKVYVETSADDFFLNNPYIENNNRQPKVYNTATSDKEAQSAKLRRLQVKYDDDDGMIDNPWSLHKVHEHRKHFIYGMLGYLNCKLGLEIELTKHHADLHLTEEEKKPLCGLPEEYWVVNCGIGPFFPAKQWHSSNWQRLFELLPDITFVQMGGKDAGHKHPGIDLPNVINHVGKTTLRSSLSLLYNAQGLISSVTYAMHAFAALQPKRPFITIAGGREQWWWEAYPYPEYNHTFLHTMGSFPCCTERYACWKSECDNKAENGGAKCLEMITPEMVADNIKQQISTKAKRAA